MTGFNQPIVDDEPAPRTWRQYAFTAFALIVIIIAGFRLLRIPPLDEAAVTLVTPAAPENFALAEKAFWKGDAARAYALLRPLADAGDAARQRVLGKWFARGFNDEVLRDQCKAVFWYEKAARGGDPFAMAYLAEAYSSGTGVAVNFDLAYIWYRQWLKNVDAAKAIDSKSANSYTQSLSKIEDHLPADPSDRSRVEATAESTSHTTAPPVVVQPLPDIPVIDFFASLWTKSMGCHHFQPFYSPPYGP